MADAEDGITQGFRDELTRFINGHAVLLELGWEDAYELGRRAAAAAVAPVLWSEAIGERHDTTAVARLLGVSRQALAKRIASGSLLGVPGRGTTWFPAWQFDPVSRQIRPVVTDIVGAFRHGDYAFDPLAVATWAATPQPELDDETPEHWILNGKSNEPVIAAAREAARQLAA